MISVIITTKDRVSFLKRAVSSVLANSLLPDEIIIVNDGGIIIEHNLFNGNSSVKINIINNEKSLGGNKARNQGIKYSNGEVLFFLDDDDAFTVETIERRYKKFESDSNIGLVYTGKSFVYDSNLQDIYKSVYPSLSGWGCGKLLLAKGNFIGSTSCVGVRKKFAESAGLFDEKLIALQDYDFWIRISKISKIEHDSNIGLIYTVHKNGTQISGDFNKYIVAGDYLTCKYKKELDNYKLTRRFTAMRYLRVSIAATKSSSYFRIKFAIKSFVLHPNIKSLFQIMPKFITKKVKKL